jgi:hypothetical protein
MRPGVKNLRRDLGCRVLPWIDYFLCAPTDGHRPATGRDCRRAGKRLDVLFRELGLTRPPDKGCWKEAQVLEHLGVLPDTRQTGVFVSDRKIQRMRKMARDILLCAQRNRRLVSLGRLRRFCGVAVSLTLALPMARFYTRSLSWDLSLAGLRATGGPSQATVPPADRTGRGTKEPYLAPLGPRERPWTKVRLSRQSLRDLASWRSLTRGEGRDLHPLPADLTMHSEDHARRRCGPGIRRDAGHVFGGRVAGFVRGPRFVVDVGAGRVDHFTRVEGCTPVAA